jgi:ectoine hydroxylase-related dioxygenase (phytanoyl-CoA dioxygenase family)
MTTHAAERTASEHSHFFEDNGYLVLHDALNQDEVAELRAEATSICRGERGPISGAEPSNGSIDETEEQTLSRYLCIHFPHKISDLMHRYMSHPAIVDVLTAIIGPDVKCMQSMLFIKSAGKPGQAWHQDEDFIPTRDRTLTGAWIALDDATTENGCLWVIPGSHKPGVLWAMREQTDPRFDCTDESYGFPYSDEDAVAVEVKAGSVVFFNGYLLHRSLPNHTDRGYRRALVNHYMSASSLLPWGNAETALADYRDIVLVAGSDPYAYKGTEDRVKAHLRPDDLGGCVWPEDS